MRLDAGKNGDPVIVLSKRNLQTLLMKLEREGSARTIAKQITTSSGMQFVLYVSAEPDDVHYAGRLPGEMHPIEEEKLNADK